MIQPFSAVTSGHVTWPVYSLFTLLALTRPDSLVSASERSADSTTNENWEMSCFKRKSKSKFFPSKKQKNNEERDVPLIHAISLRESLVETDLLEKILCNQKIGYVNVVYIKPSTATLVCNAMQNFKRYLFFPF